MNLDFKTSIKVELSRGDKTIYGKTTIAWNFSVEANSSGIKWLSIHVPDQTLSLELTEEIYNEAEDTDEEKETTEEFQLSDVEIDGKRFTLIQDIRPTELVIPAKGKPYLIFPESED